LLDSLLQEKHTKVKLTSKNQEFFGFHHTMNL